MTSTNTNLATSILGLLGAAIDAEVERRVEERMEKSKSDRTEAAIAEFMEKNSQPRIVAVDERMDGGHVSRIIESRDAFKAEAEAAARLIAELRATKDAALASRAEMSVNRDAVAIVIATRLGKTMSEVCAMTSLDLGAALDAWHDTGARMGDAMLDSAVDALTKWCDRALKHESLNPEGSPGDVLAQKILDGTDEIASRVEDMAERFAVVSGVLDEIESSLSDVHNDVEMAVDELSEVTVPSTEDTFEEVAEFMEQNAGDALVKKSDVDLSEIADAIESVRKSVEKLSRDF